MKTVAIIPARGGSKRIPGKNIKSFLGKPIIAYSIEAAKQCGLFDRIIVSTDDKQIASVAAESGAEIPFIRPNRLADDYTGTNAVVKHAISWLEEKGYTYDYACCIYATAPSLQTQYLKQGLELLIKTGKSFAFSVTSFPFPIQRALRINGDGLVEAIYPENIFKRSQDLEETYHDAGQFYWGRVEAFLNDNVIYSSESIPIILPRYLVQDIDTVEDWHRAELLFSALQKYKTNNL
jgi:N-acylneuraminate cytidylyltransferase